MTAQTVTNALDDARAHVAARALWPGTEHKVGLELEFHLVDLGCPARRPDWPTVQALVDGLPAMPAGSSITVEPGGQIELSTPPQVDLMAAITSLRADRDALRGGLAARGFGGAPLGADPARAAERTNPHPRYAAMEAHFAAVGCHRPGREMMTATAALQVNLDAGAVDDWSSRLALIRSLVPVLVAVSASSPYLGGHESGWHSMRQETWYAIDPGRTDPITAGPPEARWADYALAAPVMLVRDRGGDGAEHLTPVRRRLSYADWLARPELVGREATTADLDYHLTTLFPPVRPRGYVEIRCIDALPDRWWPALAALTVTLIDDPVAADEAAEACAPVATELEAAARDGLAHAGLRRAAMRCVDAAARRCPPPLAAEIEELAELLAAGRTVGDELRHRARTHGPLRLLEEEAHA